MPCTTDLSGWEVLAMSGRKPQRHRHARRTGARLVAEPVGSTGRSRAGSKLLLDGAPVAMEPFGGSTAS